MTWFRLPLFVWAQYATSLVMILGTPVVAITVAARRGRAGAAPRHLRSEARRRPGALPAPLLVLLAPGRLHHDPAGHGRDQRARRGHLAQADLRLRFVAFSSLAIAILGFLVWGHHLFVSSQSIYAGLVFSIITMLVAVPSAVKTFNWAATMYKGSVTWESPTCWVIGFMGLFTDRRADGAVPGRDGPRHPPDRHLLRRRALPLHHGRRRHHGLHGRPALLVAEDDGQDVLRRLGQGVGDPRLRRVQPDVLPAVRARLPGHAAPLSRVSRTSSRC